VTHTYLVGLVAAVSTLAFVVEMLRRGILREKFAALWLLVAVALLVMALFPTLLSRLATAVGIAVPANLLFFVSGIVLLLVSVQLSYEVSRLEARTRRLAEEVALLRDAVDGVWRHPTPPDDQAPET
jgi:hypothetical protein